METTLGVSIRFGVATRWVGDGNGVAVSTAISRTYVPSAALLGKTISVRVVARTPGYPLWGKTVAQSVAVALGQFSATPTPVISGTARVGATLKAVPGAWAPLPALTYQWLADGVVIPGAATTTYKVPVAKTGAVISLRVVAKRARFETVTVDSAGTDPVIP